MRASVIVPTAGRSAHLIDVLAALREDEVGEIIVVDDRPFRDTDVSLDVGTDPRVRVVAGPRTGPGPARQLGVETASGDVVVLLDDDVVPDPGLVRGHVDRHRAGARLVVLGPMPVELGPAPSFPQLLYARDYARRLQAYADGADVLTHLWAGNLSLRRSDALAVGVASSAFAGYRHEDRDFGLRCRAAGLRGVLAPELTARHRYVRDPGAFFADARAQGREQALLAQLHPASVETLGPEAFLTGLPPGARGLVALAQRPGGARLLRAVLGAGITAAGRLGGAPAQVPLAQLLRRVEQRDGAVRPDVGQ